MKLSTDFYNFVLVPVMLKTLSNHIDEGFSVKFRETIPTVYNQRCVPTILNNNYCKRIVYLYVYLLICIYKSFCVKCLFKNITNIEMSKTVKVLL